MDGKFAKISRLEWVALLLTACFAAGTLLWFHFGPPPGAVTFTGTGEPTAAEQQAEQTPEGERIDLNTATLSDLTRLPGIGEKKGQAILDKRTELGTFQSVDQLLEVRGIGEGILARISPYVTVTP